MTRATLACAAAVLVLLSGCGDSGDDKADAESSTEPSTAPSTEPTTVPTDATANEPVDVVRTHLAALDAGDSVTACGQMTVEYRKSSVAEAIEYDMIRKGGDCDVMVRQFAKDQQFEEGIRHLDWFEVTQVRGQIKDGEVQHFQVGMKVGFRVEDD